MDFHCLAELYPEKSGLLCGLYAFAYKGALLLSDIDDDETIMGTAG